jgi:hypothetical protein
MKSLPIGLDVKIDTSNLPVVLCDGADDGEAVKATSDQIIETMVNDQCPLYGIQKELGTITEIMFQYAYFRGSSADIRTGAA